MQYVITIAFVVTLISMITETESKSIESLGKTSESIESLGKTSDISDASPINPNLQPLKLSESKDSRKPFQPYRFKECTNSSKDKVCIIALAARKKGIDEKLAVTLTLFESRFEETVKSTAGARGIMQIMPFNAKGCGLEKHDLWDKEKNAMCGVQILTHELVFFDKKYPNKQLKAIGFALAAYNAGRDAVLGKNALVSYKETRNYVQRILSLYSLDWGVPVIEYEVYVGYNKKTVVLMAAHDMYKTFQDKLGKFYPDKTGRGFEFELKDEDALPKIREWAKNEFEGLDLVVKDGRLLANFGSLKVANKHYWAATKVMFNEYM